MKYDYHNAKVLLKAQAVGAEADRLLSEGGRWSAGAVKDAFQRDSQTCEKGFYYYSINYWFAGWEGDQKAYVEEKVIKNLKSYGAENPVWEDSREAVEQKMNLYLDQMEELQYRLEEHIGRSQEELYQMELLSE